MTKAANKIQTPHETRLADYKPPVYLVDTVAMDVDIGDKTTLVETCMQVRRNPASPDKNAPLVLNGEEQKLVAVYVDGKKLSAKDYTLTAHTLTLSGVPDKAEIIVKSTNEPAKNTALSGLYAAGPMLCTQCESQGFRRITYYPDRPDVLAAFRVTIHADKKRFPVLLANGNKIKSGSEKGGRHYAIWEDPFRKPCYLFALVAGDLEHTTDHFTTKSGRKVLIEIYVEPGHKSETAFARTAIKNAMAWDEKTYGLEYDLDRFMIVAVSYFNFGAMENKGLNIFNDTCILGRADTATDPSIAFFERVVGHEYFHNYTGDRVTCRDWFQLSLKEGLTVFREQEFCGDMNAPALERLGNVQKLRAFQFPEDAGAMAHPIRPASYQAIENFYTSTVYSKGAEVCRMIQTLVGKKGFRKGLNLYLKRHDGQAATCDDFVAAMAEANKIDLAQFMLWYSQAGTPTLDVAGKYDAAAQTYTLTVKQTVPPTPGQPKKKPMHMPLAIGLLNEKGKDMIGTRVLELHSAEESFVIPGVKSKPVPSLLRQFSAPVRLNFAYSDDDLLFLFAHDSDPFCRWEAGQKLFAKYVLDLIEAKPAARRKVQLSDAFVQALANTLRDKKIDAASKAMMLTLPTESELGLMRRAAGLLIDPLALHESREAVLAAMATALQEALWDTLEEMESLVKEKASDGVTRGQRRLKNLCMAYLSRPCREEADALAAEMVTLSQNMTDKIAGLGILTDSTGLLRQPMFELFEDSFTGQPNVMDHWLAVQAIADKKDILKDIKRLMKHKDFNIKNPNRISALIGSFMGNPVGFHAIDGSGYAFVADLVVKLDKINPIAAPRYVKPFLRYRDFDKKRQRLMKAALLKLKAVKGLSPNTHEIVMKALKG